MGVIGTRIRERMSLVAATTYAAYIATVNDGKNPGDPGYVTPDIVDLNSISLNHTNAIGDSVEEYISGESGSYRPLDTPLWDLVDPITTNIVEIEINTFRPTITLNWQPLPSIDAWSGVTTYSEEDLVSYGGTDYISIQDANLNHLPDEEDSTWWSELLDVEIETRIYRQEDSGGYLQIAVIADPGETFLDEEVKFNTHYDYQLIRFDSAFRFSSFSTVEGITTDTAPIPETSTIAPILTLAQSAVGVEITPIVTSETNIIYYVIEYRSALANSSNDGTFSVPAYPSWSAWSNLAEVQGTRLIHGEAISSKCYQYRYFGVSNYGVEGSPSPLSEIVIPFKRVERDQQNLTYFAELFHLIVPTGDFSRNIVYSHSSLDPSVDSNTSSLVIAGSWWWKNNTGIVWQRNAANNDWVKYTDPFDINLLTSTEYNVLIGSTVTVANKATILANYKKIIFRKLTLERFAAKIQNIQQDVSFISIKESFITLLDTYFNAFYGILVNVAVDSTNHQEDFVEETYQAYIETETEFSEYILDVYQQTLSRTFVNDDYA